MPNVSWKQDGILKLYQYISRNRVSMGNNFPVQNDRCFVKTKGEHGRSARKLPRTQQQPSDLQYLSRHSRIADLRAWFGMRMKLSSGRLVLGEVICPPSSHSSIASFSYVWPSAVTCGSLIISCIFHSQLSRTFNRVTVSKRNASDDCC